MMNEEINFYRELAAEIKPEGFRSFCFKAKCRNGCI